MKKSKGALEEETRFFEFVSNYPLFDDNGYMDLERVTCHLSYCFGADNKLEGSPQPRDMYYLLFDLLEEYSDFEIDVKWIQNQKITDWTPELAHFYPDGTRTYIHPSGMLFVWELWIYLIGFNLQYITPKSKNPNFDYWVNRKWVFVSAFVSSMKKEMKALVKKLDNSSYKKSGFSSYESLLFSKAKGFDYESAVNQMTVKGKVFKSVLLEMEEAIEKNSYHEVVVLAENYATQKLISALTIKGVKPKSTTLHNLIKQTESSYNCELTFKTMSSLNKWRNKRNKVIHGRFSLDSNQESLSKEDFFELSKNVAIQSIELCESIEEWYFDSIHNIEYLESEKDNMDDVH
jgi:hypothetical protein